MTAAVSIPVDSRQDSGPRPLELRVPLVVDLDGSLLRTDTLFESTFALARQHPSSLLKLSGWIMHGRAYLKHEIAQRAMPDVSTLPYRAEVLAHLRAEKRAGRTLVLATAADEAIACKIANHLDLFDRVLASNGDVNLSGERKRKSLVSEFGAGGFDYIGNDAKDFAVWTSARRALLVAPSPHLLKRVAALIPIEKVFAEPSATWHDYFNALRTHHWVKNALVLLPLIAAHRVFDLQLLMSALRAFVAFSLTASSVYLFNDLLDLPADRLHPNKRYRMLASGRIPLSHALLLLPILWTGVLLVAWPLPLSFFVVLGCYCVLMLAYSFGLKDVAILDVLILAGGYAMRVAAGAFVVHIYPSEWLLAFCVFLFLSLALIKRYSELILMQSAIHRTTKLRGYLINDGTLIAAEGVASGYITVLVLALYTNTAIAQQLYTRPKLFWVTCLLLLHWISYMWLMAHRGRMHHDPVVFALTDRISLVLIAVAGLVSAVAI